MRCVGCNWETLLLAAEVMSEVKILYFKGDRLVSFRKRLVQFKRLKVHNWSCLDNRWAKLMNDSGCDWADWLLSDWKFFFVRRVATVWSCLDVRRCAAFGAYSWVVYHMVIWLTSVWDVKWIEVLSNFLPLCEWVHRGRFEQTDWGTVRDEWERNEWNSTVMVYRILYYDDYRLWWLYNIVIIGL